MSDRPIPPLDLTAEIAALWDPLRTAVEGVLRSGHFVLGPNVTAFEAELAKYLGVKHVVGMNSGTDALVIGLRALGIGPGAEVVTTPFTFFASAEAIDLVGATPVFADIDPTTMNLDPARLEAACTPRTKAVMPVHLFGCPCDMDAIRAVADRRGLPLLEDAAQAIGAAWKGRKVGQLGRAAAFSFFPTKNLGAYGDGGCLATDDDKVADLSRMLRQHGGKQKYRNEMLGYNSRLDELQAAILRVKLPHLDRWNDARRALAGPYGEARAGIPGLTCPSEPAGARHVYHQYTVRIAGGRRDAVQAALAAAGVQTMIYSPTPVHRLPVYAGRFPAQPVAERLAGEVLSLPMYPQLGEIALDRVAITLRRAAGGRP